ncbi:uncharacterized protein [Rutidosis leptorrhynchoides]|uniref:uncharacterized protein n=1 Tax=Rutidosis leptorrhynchoides TaxID=125765 RepID=UPI003A998777
MSWVKWENVLSSFDIGGLNVGSLKAFNLALILKWKWRYFNCKNDTWVDVIKAIHGDRFDKAIGGSPWANIVATCVKLDADNILPPNHIGLHVGNGSRVTFWTDPWRGPIPLRDRFKRLYHLDNNKEDKVADKWNNDNWVWSWSRDAIGSRNAASLELLLHELEEVHLTDREDCWKCSLDGDGLFTVKNTRRYIDKVTLPSYHIGTTWLKSLPKKVNIFWWRFKRDALPVRCNLSARSIVEDSTTCPMCNSSSENIDHLFFGCTVALDVWRLIRVWLDCNLPVFNCWMDVETWIEGASLSTSALLRIQSIIVTTLWIIWRHRNGIVFNDIVISRCNLFDVIKFFAFRWLKNRGRVVSNWNTWLISPL